MPELLPLSSAAISDFRSHVSQHPSTDPVILDYLTRHINGLMCAEIEQVVTRLLRERLQAGCSDAATANYLNSFRRSAVRNASYSEIGKTLATLGEAFRDRFRDSVFQDLTQADIEKLGIAVNKRDEDAHEAPPIITFAELAEAYRVAGVVVKAVELTLTA